LSVTLNTTRQPLDPAGSPDAARSLAKLSIVGQQVARFAAVFGQAPERAGGKQALPAGVAR
jgi:hypothetical protein